MKLSGNISYFLTDRRKKVTLIVAILIALSIVVLQNYLINSVPAVQLLLATQTIRIGEELSEENTKLVSLVQSEMKGFVHLTSAAEKIAIVNLEPGELILKKQVVDQGDYIEKTSEQRYLTLKLSMEQADGWRLSLGESIELIHYDEDQLNALKILKEIRVDDLIKISQNDDFPCYAVLLVTEEQRDYIVSNRHIGRFELSK